MKYRTDLILGEAFCLFIFFYFLDSGLSVLNGLQFYFWLRDSENREYEKRQVRENNIFISCFMVNNKGKKDNENINIYFFLIYAKSYIWCLLSLMAWKDSWLTQIVILLRVVAACRNVSLSWSLTIFWQWTVWRWQAIDRVVAKVILNSQEVKARMCDPHKASEYKKNNRSNKSGSIKEHDVSENRA